MISTREKTLIHIYAHAARLADQDYRALLREHTGLASCANPSFSHADADAILAALEAVLFARVSAGLVPDPRPGSRWIRDEYYFRRRISTPSASGYAANATPINARQFHLIQQLWLQLSEFLDAPHTSDAYLAAIIVQSIGHSAPILALTRRQAGMLIDALRDRLKYAISQSKQTAALPF